MTPATVIARLPLAVSGWLALLCAHFLAGGAPLRIAVVAAYLVCCPGLALLRPFRPALRSGSGDGTGASSVGTTGTATEAGQGESGQTALLVVMLSLSALVVASTVLMLLGDFTGTRTLVAVAAITTVAALVPRLRPRTVNA